MTRRLCRAPTCDRPVHGNSLAGVCRQHLHDPDWCGCAECGAARSRQRRPGVRTAQVAYATAGSTVEGRAPVSLPAAPWERDHG